MAGELVLIIEDNEKNLKLVRDVLQFNGYRTAEALSAEYGLVLARTEPPDLILMDIQLPGMDGIAALKLLRSNPVTQHISVMALTASATTLDRQQILAAGFDGYETKPISIKEFTAQVRNILDRRRRIHEDVS